MFFWVLWNNTWDLTMWLYGLIPAFLIVVLLDKASSVFKGAKFTPSGLFYSFVYIFVFIFEMIKSNIDVFFRVLSPKLPINPGIVRVKTTLKSPMGRMILANSITLTPGTFLVDIKDDCFYIHWIEVCCDGDPEKATQVIVAKFEKILKKIYE